MNFSKLMSLVFLLSLILSCKEKEVMPCSTVNAKNIYENCCGAVPLEMDFKPGKIYLPNIFTPKNKDGINDIFTVYTDDGIEKVEQLTITNTTGLVIYEVVDFFPNSSEGGWAPGENIANGYYNVFVKVKNIDGEEFDLSGGVCVFACDEANPFDYSENCGSPSQNNGNGSFDGVLPDEEEDCL